MSADISKAFRTSGSSFTVPILSNFAKINCSTASENTSYSTYAGKAALPVHSHDINMPDDGINLRLNSTNIEADSTKLNKMLNGILKSQYKYPSFTISQKTKPVSMTSNIKETKYAHWGLNDENNFGLILQSTMQLDD